MVPLPVQYLPDKRSDMRGLRYGGLLQERGAESLRPVRHQVQIVHGTGHKMHRVQVRKRVQPLLRLPVPEQLPARHLPVLSAVHLLRPVLRVLRLRYQLHGLPARSLLLPESLLRHVPALRERRRALRDSR